MAGAVVTGVVYLLLIVVRENPFKKLPYSVILSRVVKYNNQLRHIRQLVLSIGSDTRVIKAVLNMARELRLYHCFPIQQRNEVEVSGMRWVEIIEIRSLRNEKALLEPDLPALLVELAAEKDPDRIEIYCHGELKTDWSIHFHYSSDSEKASRSLLGLRLVSLLKDFGFVHHSIWKQVRMFESS